jgi:hypothetical protein
MMLLDALQGRKPDPNDALARERGFPSAEAMKAYYAKQQQRITSPDNAGTSASSGSLLDRMFAVHPAYLLKSILDKWNKADGTSQ